METVGVRVYRTGWWATRIVSEAVTEGEGAVGGELMLILEAPAEPSPRHRRCTTASTYTSP